MRIMNLMLAAVSAVTLSGMSFADTTWEQDSLMGNGGEYIKTYFNCEAPLKIRFGVKDLIIHGGTSMSWGRPTNITFSLYKDVANGADQRVCDMTVGAFLYESRSADKWCHVDDNANAYYVRVASPYADTDLRGWVYIGADGCS